MSTPLGLEWALTDDVAGSEPRRFLIDHALHPGLHPITTDPRQAKRWTERTGPWRYLKTHKHLRKPIDGVGGPFRSVIVPPVTSSAPSKPRAKGTRQKHAARRGLAKLAKRAARPRRPRVAAK